MTDTNPKVQMKFAAMMMAKTGIERLKMGLSMFDMSKRLVVASILASGHGGDISRQLLMRFYGDDLDPETIDKIASRLAPR